MAISALSVGDMPRAKYMGNLDVESDTDSEISGAGRARNISPTRAGDQQFPPNRPTSTRNFAGSQASHRTRCSRISKTSQQSGISDVNQLVRDMLQSNADLEKERIAAEKRRQQAERDAKEKPKKLNAR